ncbi:hypothetical protein [Aureispira anguillae]|uniref:Uncharacterized protein n=1 Tax=Aureispira anguillae TaxID=2864201 RepID=A0A915YG29_9BACT|nr:hypothetical protein [Aureispira anguillae]BDS12375.1 hypothetical protein AsAng_0030960 [Aureispira anguillae]
MKKQLQGNAQSDQPQPIDKTEVLSLISTQINKLEAHEARILNTGIFDDDLLDLDDNQAMSDNFSLAAHATNAAVIMELKSLSKKVQKL